MVDEGGEAEDIVAVGRSEGGRVSVREDRVVMSGEDEGESGLSDGVTDSQKDKSVVEDGIAVREDEDEGKGVKCDGEEDEIAEIDEGRGMRSPEDRIEKMLVPRAAVFLLFLFTGMYSRALFFFSGFPKNSPGLTNFAFFWQTPPPPPQKKKSAKNAGVYDFFKKS